MMLTVKNLGLKIGNRTILNDIRFNVDNGEILSITGPSGCGKSTILKSILGASKPQTGTIILDEIDITHLHINKRDVVMVFQDFSLFPHMILEQNMYVGSGDTYLNESIIKYLGLSHLLGKYPFQMSGGEQQRATVARAIASKPKLLLLDEPFSGIDNITKKTFREKVYDLLSEHNITTIMVSHDLDDILEMSNRCIVMDSANIVQFDTLEKIYYEPKNTFVANLFSSVFEYQGKRYRPEEIDVYERFIESSQEVIVLSKKFKLFYNELLVRFSDSVEPFVVYDCHRRNISPGDSVFVLMKNNNNTFYLPKLI